MDNRRKICFVSSSGGHWEELLCLREISEHYPSFFVTEEGWQARDSKISHIYTFPQINRSEPFFVFHFVKLMWEAKKILDKEKPEAVITTGALVSFPFCLITKLKGGKVIYIESLARVYDSSITGKLVYRFADLFLVQWEDMLKVYPKAKYVGGIF